VSATAVSPEPPPALTPPAAGAPARRRRAWSGPLITLALGAALIAIVFGAEGGLQLAPLTTTLIVLDLTCGLLVAAAILVGERPRRRWGLVTLALFAALAVLTGISIIWAIDPSSAWVEANRTLTWLAVFAAGIALTRLMPGRWRALLGGVLLAAVVVSGYALLTKVFPGSLAPDEVYGRLREPFQYWNAVGLLAALGLPIALWLGARRDGHAALAALAYPLTGLLTVTMLLAYSRGALVAAGVGVALWFVVVPLRLRGATVALPGVVSGALVAIWAFAQDGLTQDRAPLALRSDAGTELGVLLATLGLLLLGFGLWATWLRDRRPRPTRTRRAWGVALLVVLALLPVAAAAALATSERGLSGSVEKAWNDLTDPDARAPANDPGRLTAIGSVRARYWRDGLEIFDARTATGVGAGGYEAARLRFRRDDLAVLHAHGFPIQTAADLGVIGLALSLALLAAWLAAALRTTGPWRATGWSRWTDERIAMATLLAVVVVFGAHSLIDWTWYIPGTVVPALLCAGWLAGRGPSFERFDAAGGARSRLRAGVRSVPRVLSAVLVIALAVAAAFSAGRPQASVDRTADALAALAKGDRVAAARLADEAADLDPLALDPLFARAEVESAAGQPAAARATLQRAVQLQPASTDAWVRLARFELQAGDPRAAVAAAEPALYLDPRSTEAQAAYLAASRAAATPAPKTKDEAKAKD
jgi:tetratricopeptide (TPR) repeat protein